MGRVLVILKKLFNLILWLYKVGYFLIGYCRNWRGLGKGMVVLYLFEKLR